MERSELLESVLKRIGLFALAVLASVTPAAVSAAASCDAQLSNVHIVRAKGSATTYFKGDVVASTCRKTNAPMHFRLYEGAKLISDVPLTQAANAISIPLPPHTDYSDLGMSASTASRTAAAAPVIKLGPLPGSSMAPLVITLGSDVRPQARVFRLPAEAGR